MKSVMGLLALVTLACLVFAYQPEEVRASGWDSRKELQGTYQCSFKGVTVGAARSDTLRFPKPQLNIKRSVSTADSAQFVTTAFFQSSGVCTVYYKSLGVVGPTNVDTVLVAASFGGNITFPPSVKNYEWFLVATAATGSYNIWGWI